MDTAVRRAKRISDYLYDKGPTTRGDLGRALKIKAAALQAELDTCCHFIKCPGNLWRLTATAQTAIRRRRRREELRARDAAIKAEAKAREKAKQDAERNRKLTKTQAEKLRQRVWDWLWSEFGSQFCPATAATIAEELEVPSEHVEQACKGHEWFRFSPGLDRGERMGIA